ELLERRAHPRAELVVADRLSREADHGEVLGEHAIAEELVDRGHELAPREVARGAEDHQHLRLRRAGGLHRAAQRRVRRRAGGHGDGRRRSGLAHPWGGVAGGAVWLSAAAGDASFTACPPNWLRSAAITCAE